MEQWQKVFGITAAQVIVCGVLYTLFAQSELQPWNSSDAAVDNRPSLPVIVVSSSEHELRPLNEKRHRDEKKEISRL